MEKSEDKNQQTGGPLPTIVKYRSRSASNVDRIKNENKDGGGDVGGGGGGGCVGGCSRRRWTMLECPSLTAVENEKDCGGEAEKSSGSKLFMCRENRLSRGLSRIFRRHQQTYHVSKEARRAMSEISLSKIRYDEDDGGDHGNNKDEYTEVNRHVRMHSADEGLASQQVC